MSRSTLVTEDPQQTQPTEEIRAVQSLRHDEDVELCDVCGLPNVDGLMKCSQCKNRFYCGKKCATVDWKKRGHKMACVKYDPAAAPPKPATGTEPGAPGFTTSRDAEGAVDPDKLSKFQYSADKIVNPHVALGQNTLVDFFHGSLAAFRGTEHPEVRHQTLTAPRFYPSSRPPTLAGWVHR